MQPYTLFPDVLYVNDFYSEAEADKLFNSLVQEIAWEQQSIRMFGKQVPEPRLTAWYGTAVYTYSGKKMLPKPWIPTLLAVKNKIEETYGCDFNSVLLNYYRNGDEYMGWHTDNEKELGTQPVIASVSLGAVRPFDFRHRTHSNARQQFMLANGSLLIMRGNTQQEWKHRLPKCAKIKLPRINLTFRKIFLSQHNGTT